VYFYELHEGDDDLMTDVILARATVMPPDDFYELVREVRAQVQDAHEEDTLVEAIAAELEREHDFLFVSDDRIVAAVRISTGAEEDALITREDEDEDERERDAAGARRTMRGQDDDDEDDDADLDELPDWATIVADMEPPTSLS
jgi:hypothetical protein